MDRWEERATSDPVRVARYWPSGRHNIGIACGPSGLLVVDLDAHGELPEDWRRIPGLHDGRDVLAQLCEWAAKPWPSSYWVATPSGGWHLYFTAPEGSRIRNSASLIGPQIDVRAQGGYVVAASSVIGGKCYEVLDPRAPVPLPPWIAHMLTRRPGDPRPAAQPGRGPAAARLAGLVRTVETAPTGRRNDALFWAANRARELADDDGPVIAALVSAALAAGLPEGEARRTIASAMAGDR